MSAASRSPTAPLRARATSRSPRSRPAPDPCGGFYLLAGAGYLGSHAADQSFSTSLAATGGGLAVRDTGGAILDSVGYGDATNAFVEAHPARRRRRPRLRAALRANPRRPRHERQCGRLLGQRDALSGGLEPLRTTRAARLVSPPSLQRGMLAPASPILCLPGHPSHWRIQELRKLRRLVSFTSTPSNGCSHRAHARGRRAGRASARAPTGAARGQRKGNRHVGTRDS